VAEKQQEYHAHLICDGNQECFKNLVLENTPIDYNFLLMDNWARQASERRAAQPRAKAAQRSLSAHGSMPVYGSPSTAERAAISLKLGGFDWEPLGVAPNEGRPS
jgi:hypothetical protein